jgi:hypothetical protein
MDLKIFNGILNILQLNIIGVFVFALTLLERCNHLYNEPGPLP